MVLSHDPHWLRAGSWFSPRNEADFAILGVGASKSALTPNKAHLTPDAIREALMRYSTWNASLNIDLAEKLSATDFGNLPTPDDQAASTIQISDFLSKTKTLVILGGDNSITFSGVSALAKNSSFEKVGVITFDAHHDLRDGISNGSPIKQLVDAGLPGKNIVQIGINDFANSKFYAERAQSLGISIIHRREFTNSKVSDIATKALEKLHHCSVIYVDIDVDVCDRSFVPAAPASMPGGISADELRQLLSHIATDPRTTAFDITEIDASIDSPDQRTLRLAALLILEIAAAKAKVK